jgi:(2Fe-2S) ferredoxin
MSGFKHHIFVCVNQRPKGDPRGCCADNGSERLQAFFKKEVERLGLKGTVRANKAGCLDHCEYGPSVVVYPEGVWYWVGSEADVTEIMERHVVKGEIVERLLMPGHVPDRIAGSKTPGSS